MLQLDLVQRRAQLNVEGTPAAEVGGRVGLPHIADGGLFSWLKSGLVSGLVRWHLLSLDAPTVAALWTWFVARCAGLALPWKVTAAMFVAVWLLYAADRLLDGRGEARESELEARHRFHRAHRGRFAVAMGLGTVALAPLVAEMAKLPGSAFRSFLGLGALLAAWFGVIHLARPLGSLRGTKELAPGLFFGAAVFLPTLMRAPELRPWLEVAATAFGLVCWVNCRLIDRWEHAGVSRGTPVLVAVVAVGSAALASVRPGPMTPVLLAVSLAAAGLLALDRLRGRMERTTLRAAADLALLTPLVVLAWVK